MRNRLLSIAAALIAVALTGVAGAQRGGDPARGAQRAAETVAQMQDRAARAQDRAEAGQDRAGRITEVAGRATAAFNRGMGIRSVAANARALAATQMSRSRDMVRAHPGVLELSDRWPTVRGEVVALDPDHATLNAARSIGYGIIADEVIEGLDLRAVTLRVPNGKPVQRALANLRRLAPQTSFSANHVHLQSGAAALPALPANTKLAQSKTAASPSLGIIDGGVARHSSLSGPIEQRGFTNVGPVPNAHATAVASLAAGTGIIRGAAPGAALLVADVYGRSPSGGNALTIARALGWLVARRVPVAVVSLVGPANPLVARAVSQAQARGLFIVAPVGNAGPAAPPSYPASYPRVIAVTGVDARNRALIEAGRALHLDYAAPGADIYAARGGNEAAQVRGTSFAVPLVAARLWRATRTGRPPLAVMDSEAVDLGRPGADKVFGRGLVCGQCAARGENK